MSATKSTALITGVLGPTLSEKLISDMRNSKFSILTDESTDCGKIKHLCIVVRYFSEKKQCIITQYLGLMRIEDASANGIYTAIKDFFKAKGIQEDNCIGFASDGASVMVGKHNSLYSKLRDDIPHLCCSPKRRETYNVLYETINNESPLQNPGLADTRWLSRYTAVKRILDQWEELKLHFRLAANKEKCYMADYLNKMYNDEPNLLFMKFLLPLLEKFQTMILKFQARNPDPNKLFKELRDFQHDIMSRVVNPNRIGKDSNWDKHIMHTNACFYGTVFQLACTASQLQETYKTNIKDKCKLFLVEAVREVEYRVPASGEHLEVLSLMTPKDDRGGGRVVSVLDSYPRGREIDPLRDLASCFLQFFSSKALKPSGSTTAFGVMLSIAHTMSSSGYLQSVWDPRQVAEEP
ncbi:hypothetical protein Pcinc_021633 [Petrolisthes cinctipes]|uniref:DUF4371 domain-containing protein n=1 Tax=Petrolisthes cinctipes TaxID=88211 RepID=A0AAE1FFL1_PETCI|nr:hypothetical protein Pcinc_021633 [Petrolisthes cinctipes]